MRSDNEIVERIEKVSKTDWLGTQRNELLCRLPYNIARGYLKDGVTREQWSKAHKKRDRETILAEMLDYMPFAWEKANNFRSISAGRSMDHYAAWLWLLGDDLGDLTDYQYYGKDILVDICNKYRWDSSQWDDGIRANSESEAY